MIYIIHLDVPGIAAGGLVGFFGGAAFVFFTTPASFFDSPRESCADKFKP